MRRAVDFSDVHVDGARAGFIVGFLNNGQGATQVLKSQSMCPCKMVHDTELLQTVCLALPVLNIPPQLQTGIECCNTRVYLAHATPHTAYMLQARGAAAAVVGCAESVQGAGQSTQRTLVLPNAGIAQAQTDKNLRISMPFIAVAN